MMARATKSAMRSSGPRKVRLADIEWTEKYECYRATVYNWLELGFERTSFDGYHATIAGRTLQCPVKTVEEAAVLAVETARTWLRRALDELEGGK